MKKAYLRYVVAFIIAAIVGGCSKKEVYTFNHGSSYQNKVKTQEIAGIEKDKETEVIVASIEEKITIPQVDNGITKSKVEKQRIEEKEELTELVEYQTGKKLNVVQKKVLKKLQKKAAKQNYGDSQIVALILCFFLGGLGIHRFYLGYPVEGILQLLTAGGCGIWWLIDLIRIVIGDLQPNGGRYTETL